MIGQIFLSKFLQLKQLFFFNKENGIKLLHEAASKLGNETFKYSELRNFIVSKTKNKDFMNNQSNI